MDRPGTMIEDGLYYPNRPESYHANCNRVQGDDWPCFVCGKPIKREKARYWTHTWGGRDICTPEFAQANPDGDSGNYPIGSSCYRKLPVEIRVFLTQEVR